MSVYLSDLLAANILDSYQVVSGKAGLNRIVESISLLETPEFEKYVRDKALILTTLYPIKSNINLFNELIHVLVKHKVTGIIVKLKRYVEAIPDSIQILCEKLQFPLITIDYDANLSEISTRVLNELTTKELKTDSFSSFYLDLVKMLDANPRLENILSFQERFDSMDYWIYSKPQDKCVSTNKKINKIAEEVSKQPYNFQKINQVYVYTDEVKLSNQLLYQVVFFSNDDNRNKMYYYAEIVKLMLVFIFQKRQEISLQQNQFLLELITSTNLPYSNNENFIEKADFYGWRPTFPLTLILIQMTFSNHKKTVQKEDLRDYLLSIFKLEKSAIRFLQVNQQILFIMNDRTTDNFEIGLRKMINEFEANHKFLEMKLAYATRLTQVGMLTGAYATLSRGLNFINQRHIREKVFNNQSVKMFSLLGKISEVEIKEYVDLVLSPLLDYEQKHGGNLLETLYRLITHQFHLRKTAAALFVHYNTLRHRLQVLESLGYGKNKLETSHYDLIFAVYLAKNLVINKQDTSI